MSLIAKQTTTFGLWEQTGAPAAQGSGPQDTGSPGDAVTEFAIIGGGYCGLSAGLHLAEAGHEPLILEAEEPGFGASGRNGGQVIAGLKLTPDELKAHFPAAQAEAMVRFGTETAELVYSLIERFQIRCEAHRDGWVLAAHSDAMLKAARARVADLQKTGADVSWLETHQIQRLLGTRYYTGGMIDRRSGMVQPLSYVRGLAQAAAAAGARIRSGCRVTALRRDGAGWRLETSTGTIRAKYVLLATNGYIGDLYPALKNAMIILQSYQIATDPLPDHLDKTVLPSRLPVADLMDMGVYYRRDDAGRFIVGGRGTLTEKEKPHLYHGLVRPAQFLYPQLREVPFTQRWGGKLTLTRDHLPRVIEVEPGLIAAYGCNGRGVAMATLMGRVAAERFCGVLHPDLPITTLQPSRYPMHSFRLPAMYVASQFATLRRRFAKA